MLPHDQQGTQHGSTSALLLAQGDSSSVSAPLKVTTRVMSSICMLYLNAQGCKIFVTNIRGCLESMQLPCFNSCGKMIFMVLRYLSRHA